MATAQEVLGFLIPNGGWVLTGNEYEGIAFIECEPITKKAFEDGFDACDDFKSNQKSEKAAAKAALLERLGITVDEAALLLQ